MGKYLDCAIHIARLSQARRGGDCAILLVLQNVRGSGRPNYHTDCPLHSNRTGYKFIIVDNCCHGQRIEHFDSQLFGFRLGSPFN